MEIIYIYFFGNLWKNIVVFLLDWIIVFVYWVSGMFCSANRIMHIFFALFFDNIPYIPYVICYISMLQTLLHIIVIIRIYM